MPSRKFECSLVGHTNWVRSAEFNPDANWAVTGGDDKLVKLWDVGTHKELNTFFDHNDCVNQVAFTPDGNGIAACSADNSIKVWDARSRNLIQHYPAHGDSVTSFSIHPSGNYLLSSSRDASLKIWDLREGRLMYSLQGHNGPVNACEFSNDGTFFATGGADQLVMVWKSNLIHGIEPEVEWGVPAESKVKPIPKVTRTRPVNSASRLSGAVSGSSGSPSLKGLLLTQSKPMPESQGPYSPSASQSKIPVSKRSVTQNASKAAAAVPTPRSPAGVRSSRAEVGSPVRPPVAPSQNESSTSSTSTPGIEQTLGRILGQLDLVTKTIISMENRLTINEDRVTNMIASAGAGGATDTSQFLEAGAFDEDDD